MAPWIGASIPRLSNTMDIGDVQSGNRMTRMLAGRGYKGGVIERIETHSGHPGGRCGSGVLAVVQHNVFIRKGNEVIEEVLNLDLAPHVKIEAP